MAGQSESRRPGKFHRETPFLPDPKDHSETPDYKAIGDVLSLCIRTLIEDADFLQAVSAALKVMGEKARFKSVKYFRVSSAAGDPSFSIHRLFTWNLNGRFRDNMFGDKDRSAGRAVPESWNEALHLGKSVTIEKGSDIRLYVSGDSPAPKGPISAVPVMQDGKPVALALVFSSGIQYIHPAWISAIQELCTHIDALCRRRHGTYDADQRQARELELIRRAIYRTLDESVRHRNELKKAYRLLENQNAKLKDAKKTAEESARLKSEFLAASSRELKTPLNSMIGFLGMYLRKKLGEQERRKLVQTAHDSATKLLGLIDNILEYSRGESGRRTAFPEEIPVGDFSGGAAIPKEQKDRLLKILVTGLPLQFLHMIEQRIAGPYQFVREAPASASATLSEKDGTWDIFIAGLAQEDGPCRQCISKAIKRGGLRTIVISSLPKDRLKEITELGDDSIASVLAWDSVMKDSAPVTRRLESIRTQTGL